jgi:hypothetical protein
MVQFVVSTKERVMAQQDMEFEGANRDSPKSSSYTGYEGVPPYSDYTSGSYAGSSSGQKLSGSGAWKAPGPGQRLALAIVSLALMMGLSMFLVGMGVIIIVHGISLTIFAPIVAVCFICFGIAVIVVNVVFNRKH